MSEQVNGGPAFPTTPENTARSNGMGGAGMTLRDYFAAKAMQGMASGYSQWADLAADAYNIADAMLEAREK